MNAQDDGGPAFPCWSEKDNQGMSLRDYFATAAMQTYLHDVECRNNNDKLAEWSYEAADAMLKARAK